MCAMLKETTVEANTSGHAVRDPHHQLRVRAAWLYHVEGLTQSDVAKKLGVNRIMITRLLSEARARGEVIIRIKSDIAPAGRPAARTRGRVRPHGSRRRPLCRRDRRSHPRDRLGRRRLHLRPHDPEPHRGCRLGPHAAHHAALRRRPGVGGRASHLAAGRHRPGAPLQSGGVRVAVRGTVQRRGFPDTQHRRSSIRLRPNMPCWSIAGSTRSWRWRRAAISPFSHAAGSPP